MSYYYGTLGLYGVAKVIHWAICLPLLLGILIIVILPIVRSIDSRLLSNQAVGLYVTLVEPVILYLAFWFLAFITSFILTRLYRPKYNQEYIIVLGAGLLNGKEVSPLLASRIQIALDLLISSKTKQVTILG